MSTLVFNFQKTPLWRTLGVAKYALRLAEALAPYHHIIVLLRDDDELDALNASRFGQGTEVIRVTPDQKSLVLPLGGDAVEIRAHHFQPRLTVLRSITLLHDFHVFHVPWKYADPVGVQQLIIECMSSSDAIVTEFPYTYFHYTSYTGLPANRLFLTGSPLLMTPGPKADSDATRRVAALPGRKLFYPAQLQQHKNHLVLVEALRALNVDERVFLILTGTVGDEEYGRRLELAIEASRMREQVVHLGNLTDDEVMTLYTMVDATVVPSLAEGGAYVPLEALSAGCPVAASDIPAAREHLRSAGVDEDGAVSFFEASSPEAVANAVRGILARSTLMHTGGAPAVSLPAWSDIAQDWNKIINWLLGSSPRPFTQLDSTFRVGPLSND